MKKSSFVAMVLGVIAGVLFSLGMCMVLVEEFGAFTPGIVLGSIGLVVGLIAVFVWRKMTHQKPIHITGKTALSIFIGIVGTIGFGLGMCLCMVWNQMVLGVVIGLVGILILLSLVPICKGLHD